jgi:hypothetical protein
VSVIAGIPGGNNPKNAAVNPVVNLAKPRPRTKHAMTDQPRPNERALARQNRLREALRENLKRRKTQSRGRIDQTAVTSEQGACGGDPAPSHSRRVEQGET